MKIFVLLLFTLILGGLSGSILASPSHMITPSTCDNPTESIAISTVQTGLAYNTTELKVSKNTCVTLTFINLQMMEHDFVIDADTNNNFEMVHLHLSDDTDGVNGGNYIQMNVSTPNTDITYEFYCSMVGHRPTMHGNFVVGSGSPSSTPGFELAGIFLSLVTIVSVIKFRKKN